MELIIKLKMRSEKGRIIGYHNSYSFPKNYFRDALIWAIIGGTFEIVKLIIDQQNVSLFEKDVDGKYVV